MQDTLQDISAQLDAIAHQVNRPDIVERLHKVSSAQQINGVSLAVLGVFRCGKSTLINALLDHEVLPTSTPLTGQNYIVVTIAESPKAIVNFSNGEKKTVSPIPAALTNAARSGSIGSFEIQYPSNRLEKGMRIMEVPGTDPPYRELLSLILDQANAVIYVMDARQPLSKEEQAILSNFPSHITRLIIAVTKFDEIATAEQDETFKRAVQQIEELRLPIKAEVYKVAPQIILKDQYQPALLSAWEEFKQAILKIPPAPFAIQQPGATQISTLSAIAKDLHDILVQSNTKSVSSLSSLSEQQILELRKTRDLLKRVISDQTNDIEQTLKDSFKAFLFKLQDNLKTHRLSPDLIESEVNSWLDNEKMRMETRFSRLYKSVLEDAGSALSRKLDFAPDMLPIPSIRYSTAQMQQAPTPLLANLSKEQRSILIGGVTVAVIGGFLGGPIGWTLLITGTGAAGATLYVIVRQRQAGGRAEQMFDKVEIAIPEGIEKNIQHNAQCLKDFIDNAFREESTHVSGSKHEAHTFDSPVLEELRRIQATLGRLATE